MRDFIMLKKVLIIAFLGLSFSIGIAMDSDNEIELLKSTWTRQPDNGIELKLPDGSIIDLKNFHKLDMKIQNSTELGVANLERLQEAEEGRLDKAREAILNSYQDIDIEQHQKNKKHTAACNKLEIELEKINKLLDGPMVQIGLQCLQCCTWIVGFLDNDNLKKHMKNNQRILTTQQMKRK